MRPPSRHRRQHAMAVAPTAPVAWSRPKLLALLATGVVLAVLLLTGLALAVAEAVRPVDTTPAPAASGRDPNTTPLSSHIPESPRSEGGSAGVSHEVAARDALAARPMPVVPESASHPAPVSMTDPGAPIALPPSTAVGPAGVPSGFAHTPEGALAQLAAIDQTALSSGTMAGVRVIIANWAMPGGPTTTSWSGVHAMARLLTAAGLSGGGSRQLAVVATPLMGLIKGTVGPDYVVACIDLELDVTIAATARGAVADCQRMQWQAGRWIIGPGAEAAEGPSVWPDSDLAVQVGYRDLQATSRRG